MTKFVKLNRVYKMKDTGELKSGSIVLNVGSIATVRASNRLGYPEHRTTVLMADGTEIDLSNTFSEVTALIGA